MSWGSIETASEAGLDPPEVEVIVHFNHTFFCFLDVFMCQIHSSRQKTGPPYMEYASKPVVAAIRDGIALVICLNNLVMVSRKAPPYPLVVGTITPDVPPVGFGERVWFMTLLSLPKFLAELPFDKHSIIF